MSTEEVKINIPDTGMSETAHTVIGDYILFVTIEHDQDCSNPLDDDAMGIIWSRNRHHINHKDDEEIRDLLEENPDAVRLSYYEHGLSRWDVAGTQSYPDAEWDSCPFGGLWVPDKCLVDEAEALAAGSPERAAKMAEWAGQACEVYTEWCNGNCFGYIVKAYMARYEDGTLYDQPDDYRLAKAIHDDACWGFYGEYVLEAAKDEAESTVRALLKAAEVEDEPSKPLARLWDGKSSGGGTFERGE